MTENDVEEYWHSVTWSRSLRWCDFEGAQRLLTEWGEARGLSPVSKIPSYDSSYGGLRSEYRMEFVGSLRSPIAETTLCGAAKPYRGYCNTPRWWEPEKVGRNNLLYCHWWFADYGRTLVLCIAGRDFSIYAKRRWMPYRLFKWIDRRRIAREQKLVDEFGRRIDPSYSPYVVPVEEIDLYHLYRG